MNLDVLIPQLPCGFESEPEDRGLAGESDRDVDVSRQKAWRHPAVDIGKAELLEVPVDFSVADIDSFVKVPAVEAFFSAMVAREPGFTIDSSNQSLVAKICLRSGGLVADLNLAARMAHSEGLGVVASVLDASDWHDGLPRLVARHGGWQPTLDPADVRSRVLGLAAGMRSGFGIEAIRTISGISGIESILCGLVGQSLLIVSPIPLGQAGGISERRFQVPLAASAVAEWAIGASALTKSEFRQLHAAYYLDLALRHVAALAGRGQQASFWALHAESRNIEEAIRFLVADGPGEAGSLVVRVLSALIPFWMRYGEVGRAERLLGAALDLRSRVDRRLAGELQVVAAEVFTRLGEVETASRLLDEADSARDRSSDGRVAQSIAQVRGLCATASGVEQGIASFRAALGWAGTPGPSVSRLALDLSLAEYFAGQRDVAARLARRLLAEATLQGDELTAGAALLRLAAFAAGDGCAESASDLFVRGMAKLRRLGPRSVVGELSALAGNQLVTNVMIRASNVAQILGSFYAGHRYTAGWGYPDYAVGEKESEIRNAIGISALSSNVQDGSVRSLPSLLSSICGGTEKTVVSSPLAMGISRAPTAEAGLARSAYGSTVVAAAPDGRSKLTAREREVAVLVGEGMTNRQIARALAISEWTVVNHMRQIMRKLTFTSRVQVAKWVHSGGISGVA